MRRKAQTLAQELGVPFAETEQTADLDLLLVSTPERLELRDNRDQRIGPVSVDFSSLDLRPFGPGLSRRQPLARAFGKKVRTIADATAGLAQDALLLALMGFQVTAIERSGVVGNRDFFFLDENGKLVTESLRDFTKKALRKRFASLSAFLQRWTAAERKQAIIEELANEGLPLDPLADEVGKDLDPFDLICHVAFDRRPLTRRERAQNVRKRDVFAKYGPQARAVLEALLAKYQDDGVLNLDDPRILHIAPFDLMGTPTQLIREFGTRADFERAVHELQAALYQEVA